MQCRTPFEILLSGHVTPLTAFNAHSVATQKCESIYFTFWVFLMSQTDFFKAFLPAKKVIARKDAMKKM